VDAGALEAELLVRDESPRPMVVRRRHKRAAALDAIDRDEPLLRAVRELAGG
jgi:hypothetical protein